MKLKIQVMKLVLIPVMTLILAVKMVYELIKFILVLHTAPFKISVRLHTHTSFKSPHTLAAHSRRYWLAINLTRETLSVQIRPKARLHEGTQPFAAFP